jgi:hypothetical protein
MNSTDNRNRYGSMRRFRSLVTFLACGLASFFPSASYAGVSIGLSITVAPPVLPVYVQPPLPGPNYIWAPGYWAYGDDDYYWVPGTWVLAPSPSLLWTPGYWGWREGFYVWNAGYWGPHIGYYGGINYGCGYVGVGYAGGYWSHGAFFYNTAVTHVNTTVVTNVYNKTVINNTTVNNVSFNGGKGGIQAQPTAQEKAWSQEQHTAPTELQTQHEHAASTNRALFASVNHGTPAIAATAKPGVFTGAGIIAPKGFKATSKARVVTGSTTTKLDMAHPKGLKATSALPTGPTTTKLDMAHPTDRKTSNHPVNQFALAPNPGKVPHPHGQDPHPGAHGPPVHAVNQHAHPKQPKKAEKNG